jgi:hypothetical protein
LKRVLVAIAGVALSLCLFVTVILNSSAALGALAGLFGYDVQADDLSFSPLLSGSAKNIRISGPADSGLTLICDNVTVSNSLDLLLKGHIDTLILENPKLTFRLGKEKTDFSFLKKLPDIRLLDIRKAQATLTFAGNEQKAILNDFNLTVKNFSPQRGGDITILSKFSFTDSPKATISAAGSFKSAFRLTGFYPKPFGTGTAELLIDKATYAVSGKPMELAGLALNADIAYDQKTDTLALRSLKGASKQFGSILATGNVLMHGTMPWSATLAVSAIDFSEAFGIARPALPDEYQSWTMQGKGTVESAMRGTYAKDMLAMDGSIAFTFSKGGFSSADASKAAQDVSGTIILKLQYGGQEQKLTFSGRVGIDGGEYLWGKLYSNLAGRKATVSTDGAFFLSEKRLQLTSSTDLYGIATTSLSFDGTRSAWKATLPDTVIRNDLAASLLLKDFLENTSPTLKNVSATGSTTVSVNLDHTEAGTAARGMLLVRDASVKAPGREISVESIAIQLPVWLFITPDGKSVERPKESESGLLTIKEFRKGKLHVPLVKAPLYISRNYIRIAEQVSIPLFDGDFVLYRLGLDDIPHPAVGFRLGIRIEGINLGQMTKELIDNEYTGIIFADTGILSYRNERLQGDGQFLVRVFGGDISFQNFFFEKIFSPARRYGADVVFSGISLEQVTQKVPVGHMSGIIEGSLKNFVMEYDQPASFDLVMRSAETSGVKQRFSMDAIESITVIGTGVRTSVKGGLASLFRDFPYSQIGIKCTLRNDEFTVRGTIESGGKEYLVKRGWLRGVDIVNQNRENKISFQDMQERIKRVMDGQPPASGIPEVK